MRLRRVYDGAVTEPDHNEGIDWKEEQSFQSESRPMSAARLKAIHSDCVEPSLTFVHQIRNLLLQCFHDLRRSLNGRTEPAPFALPP